MLGCNVSCQCISAPTVRYIADFAVGDTFHYSFGSNSGYQSFYETVITDRAEYGSDSLVYSTETVTLTSGNQVSHSTGTIRYVELDSIISGVFSEGAIVDEFFCNEDIEGPVYHLNTHRSVSLYCSFIGQNVTADSYSEFTYAPGLGETYFHSCSNTTPCNYCSARTLVYARKVNGFIYGTPVNFPTSIESSGSQANILKVFPNPVDQQIIVESLYTKSSDLYITVFDITGKLIIKEPLNSGITIVRRSFIPCGLFLWQIEENSTVLERGKLTFN